MDDTETPRDTITIAFDRSLWRAAGARAHRNRREKNREIEAIVEAALRESGDWPPKAAQGAA